MIDKLYVCTVYDNRLNYKSRYMNYSNFRGHVGASSIHTLAALYTAEVTSSEKHSVILASPTTLVLRTESEMWHKENALNELFKILPAEAEYIAWVDADVQFANPLWVEATIQQLKTYEIVQMFSHTMDLGLSNQPIDKPYPSYMYQYVKDNRDWSDPVKRKKDTNCVPGLGWAARKSTLNKLGGLIDWAIVGGADYHMATALIGNIDLSIPVHMTQAYNEMCVEWQNNVTKDLRRNIGYVPGLLLHHWHGDRKKRRYKDRNIILSEGLFNPRYDLVRNLQGLWEFTERGGRLRNEVRSYLHNRNDDETGEILIP